MAHNNVLVTGGAGYIGSHTCKALYTMGFQPVVYDNLVSGHRNYVKWGEFVHGDICDNKKLTEVLLKYKPIAVIHFAAFAYVGESVLEPAKYYINNVAGSLSLIEAMRLTGLKRIIFSSTCATYGIPDKLPVSEDHQQNPINPYGRTKYAIENILKDYQKAYGMDYIILRYFNAAGADPDAEIGENHDPETHLIPLVLEAARNTDNCVSVFGDDYPTNDGTCIRDYIHVSDLANAHVNALEYLLKYNQCNIFNLGNGTGFSVKEIIDAAERVTKSEVKFKIKKRREGDPAILIGDAKKAMNVLSWKPKYYQIDDIIETSWNWHKVLKNS